VAIFSSLDYQSAGPFNFFDATYRMLGQDNPLIQFVSHSNASPIVETSELRSEFPRLDLRFGASAQDPECLSSTDLGTKPVFQDHKVGGMPYFGQLEGQVMESLPLLNSGWIHLLQLVFPGIDDDETPGSWPFGESAFHVFCRREQNEYVFKYCWG
jgi:hypothetical protein